ncbi:MAG: plasmid stabilization protein [Gallionellales bacterium CG_4_10_14_3_um_filter_54_96]|nr:MAG: plasmid stabilization protein [Gallionellales bacterium CG03_land_8_20_14_0_80_55_15]PIV92149.1 MAG: plasmid stabilization protein [Gallionellales bacterium CG17_big_fil_post_rev_8_21_14_2_50_54_146]PIY03731.1 MAG: plasmid stabilization protein [Gallionellales bacterium CG_4_10_14_3_um_filter_54_96]HCJ50628.1 plasmid stabilization protein [Gallionella sp.]
MKLIFLRIARNEMAEIKRYYNFQQKGLGDAFQREAQTAAQLILARPLSWQIEIEPTRRFILNRFPYKMVYLVQAEQVVIVAVMHQHRRPDYWVDHLPNP